MSFTSLPKFLSIPLFIILCFMPILSYMYHYANQDCDDKAVHYYSAAMDNASLETQKEILEGLNVWLLFIPQDHHSRVLNRFLNWKNYPLANFLINVIRNNRESLCAEPAFAKNIKISFFLMFLSSYLVLLWAAYRSSLGIWPILILLCVLTFQFVNQPFIHSFAQLYSHPLISYVPRGSATLLVLAMFMAYGENNRIMFLFIVAILFLWHQGFALIIFLIMGINVLMMKLLLDKTQDLKTFLFYLISLCTFMILIIFEHRQSFIGLSELDEDHVKIFAHSTRIYFIVLMGVVFFIIYLLNLKTRRSIPKPQFNLIMTIGLTLFLSIILSIGSINRVLFLRPEVVLKLSGLNQLLFLSMLIYGLWIVYLYGITSNNTRRIFQFSIVLLCLNLFIVNFNSHIKIYFTAPYSFFEEDCLGYTPLDITKDNLKIFSVTSEAEFYYSVGEYIFRKNKL